MIQERLFDAKEKPPEAPAEQSTADPARLLRVELLKLAVACCQQELQKKTWNEIRSRIPVLEEVMQEKSEFFIYRGKPGDTAAAFSAVVEMVAILSFFPYGIDAFDSHFEAQHPCFAPYPDATDQ